MADIPCFLSTCSIDLDADPVDGFLIANLNMAPTGSIACDGDGVFTKIAGLTNDATSGVAPGSIPCGQSLARATDGQMFAYPTGAAAFDYVGLEETPLDGDDSDYNTHATLGPRVTSHDVVVANPFGCDAWCHFIVPEMKVMGSRRPDTGGDGTHPNHAGGESFYVTGYFNLALRNDVDGCLAGHGWTPVTPTDVLNSYNNRFDVHGSWSGEGNAPGHQIGHPMHALFKLGPNEYTTVRARIVEIARYHFAQSGDGGLDGGVAILHPGAVFWRDDPRGDANPC